MPLDNSNKEEKDARAFRGKEIKIIGWVNFVFFGLINAAADLYAFFLSYNPKATAELMRQLPAYQLKGMSKAGFLRIVLFWEIIVAAGFIVSGWGIIKKKPYARRFSLYFAGLLLFLIALGVLLQAFTNHALAWINIMLSIAWPAAIIFFLTSPAADSYFAPHLSQHS